MFKRIVKLIEDINFWIDELFIDIQYGIREIFYEPEIRCPHCNKSMVYEYCDRWCHCGGVLRHLICNECCYELNVEGKDIYKIKKEISDNRL